MNKNSENYYYNKNIEKYEIWDKHKNIPESRNIKYLEQVE